MKHSRDFRRLAWASTLVAGAASRRCSLALLRDPARRWSLMVSFWQVTEYELLPAFTGQQLCLDCAPAAR